MSSMHVPDIEHSQHPKGVASKVPYYWWVIVLTTLAMVQEGFVIQGIPVLYPFIREEFGLTRAQIGLITSGLFSASMFTVILGGWISDVYGAKRILVLMMLYSLAPILAFTLVQSFHVAILVGFLIGISAGPCYPATSKAVMDWVPQKFRAFGMSLKQTGPTIAGALAALTLPYMAMNYGWRSGLIVLAIITAIVLLIFQMFYRDVPRAKINTRKMSVSDFGQILNNPSLVVLTIWGFFFVGLQFIILSYLILFLVESLRYSEVTAGAYLGMALAISTAARILWGAACDFLLNSKRKITLAIIGFTAGASFVMIGLVNQDTPIITVVVLICAMGGSAMSWPGIFTTFVAEISGSERSGTTIGSTNAIMRIGAIIIPPIFGLCADTSGSYTIGWLAMGCCAIIATLAMLSIAKEPDPTLIGD